MAIIINNSKDDAIIGGKWSNPGASFYNELIKEDNYKSLLDEAYLLHGDITKTDDKLSFSASGCKYPHHSIRNGKLVVNEAGVKAAYQRAKQMGVFKGEVKKHLERHYRELGLYADSTMNESADELYMITEASHGNLKYAFRLVKDANTGHNLKIVYELKNMEITGTDKYRNHASYLSMKDNVQKGMTPMSHTKKYGNLDFESKGGKVVAIIDMDDNNKKLQSAECVGPFAGVNNHQRFSISVGEVDNSETFKSTFWGKRDNTNLSIEQRIVGGDGTGRGFKFTKTDSDVSAKLDNWISELATFDKKILGCPEIVKLKIDSVKAVEKFIDVITHASSVAQIKNIKLDEYKNSIDASSAKSKNPFIANAVIKDFNNLFDVDIKKVITDLNNANTSNVSDYVTEIKKSTDKYIIRTCSNIEKDYRRIKNIITTIHVMFRNKTEFENILNGKSDFKKKTYFNSVESIKVIENSGILNHKLNNSGFGESVDINNINDVIENNFNFIESVIGINPDSMLDQMLVESADIDDYLESILKSIGDNPSLLIKWMDDNIKYDDNDTNWTLKDPSVTAETGIGNCHDQSLFEKAWFDYYGFKNNQIFFIEYNENETTGGATHTLSVFTNGNSLYWFEHAWENCKGIHGPFDSTDDVVAYVHDMWEKNKSNTFQDINFSFIPNYKIGMTLDEYVDSWQTDAAIEESMSWIDSIVHDDNFRTQEFTEASRGKSKLDSKSGNKPKYDECIENVRFIKSDDGVNNCAINVKGYDVLMRGRSAMIVLRKNGNEWEMLTKKHSGSDYGVPGGGWNKDEDPRDAAIRELHEECLSNAKKVRRHGTLIEFHDKVAGWVKEHVPDKKDWWYGYYSAIFVGIYNGKFKGHVDVKDRESGYDWKSVSSIKNKLPKEYADAIDAYIGNYAMTESFSFYEDGSMAKRADEAESDKNGVNRKKLYIAFIEWCKSFNKKNTFGSNFDKDVFNVTYPFVPRHMRYFYRLADPNVCVLSGDLTFFSLSELKKVNSSNSHMDEMLIFAATPNDMRIFNIKDRKVYLGEEDENGEIKLTKVLGETFDLYIQTMINKGDFLNAPKEVKKKETPEETQDSTSENDDEIPEA